MTQFLAFFQFLYEKHTKNGGAIPLLSTFTQVLHIYQICVAKRGSLLK